MTAASTRAADTCHHGPHATWTGWMRSGGVSDPPGPGGRAPAAFGRGVAHAPAASWRLSQTMAGDSGGINRRPSRSTASPAAIERCRCLYLAGLPHVCNSAARRAARQGGTPRRMSVPPCVPPPQPSRGADQGGEMPIGTGHNMAVHLSRAPHPGVGGDGRRCGVEHPVVR